MTSVREPEGVVQESRAEKPRDNRRFPVVHRRPRGAFLPTRVSVYSALALSLMLALSLALRF